MAERLEIQALFALERRPEALSSDSHTPSPIFLNLQRPIQWIDALEETTLPGFDHRGPHATPASASHSAYPPTSSNRQHGITTPPLCCVGGPSAVVGGQRRASRLPCPWTAFKPPCTRPPGRDRTRQNEQTTSPPYRFPAFQPPEACLLNQNLSSGFASRGSTVAAGRREPVPRLLATCPPPPPTTTSLPGIHGTGSPPALLADLLCAQQT